MSRAKPNTPGDRTLLTASLDGARRAVVATLVGIPDALLGEPLLSPGSSLLGVIKHLTLLERLWFAHTFAGLDVVWDDTDDQPPIGWWLEPSDTARTVVAGYRAECQRSRELIEHAGLDDAAARSTPSGCEVVLRWVVLHMIEQTNRHAGHADVLRHLIEGAV
jgi:hypothetical protein